MDSTRYPKDDDTEAKIALLLEYRKLAEWVWQETPALKKAISRPLGGPGARRRTIRRRVNGRTPRSSG